MPIAENALTIAGRFLLGLYFLIPGITKLTGFDSTAEYMAAHGMVAIPFFLLLTAVIQIGGAVCLIVGFRIRLVAFVLAGLVLVISVVMHDFWNMEAGQAQAHEMQNFIKNLAIMAGLMVISGNPDWISRRLFAPPRNRRSGLTLASAIRSYRSRPRESCTVARCPRRLKSAHCRADPSDG